MAVDCQLSASRLAVDCQLSVGLTPGAGQVLRVLSTAEPGEGWWTGGLRGRRGMFPATFVEVPAAPHP